MHVCAPPCLGAFSACVKVREPSSGGCGKGQPSGDSWQRAHAKLHEEILMKLPHGAHEPQKWSQQKCMRGVRTARERDNVDLAFLNEWVMSPPSLPSQDIGQGLIVDLSQSAGRRNWSKKVRSVVRHSRFYCFSLDRTLHSSEHLRLLGMVIPKEKTAEFSPHQLRDLSGEMFAPPVVAFVQCLVLTSMHEAELGDPL